MTQLLRIRPVTTGLLAFLVVQLAAAAVPAQELSTRSLLDFANTRYQAYFHYNLCTFKNLSVEEHQGRTYGEDPPSLWNPTGLDCEQWARVCKENRIAGGWLTTKHHGGFCLWDSKHTDYDVASSPVKTDVVREFVDEFRKAGLKIGFYYSILDYHHGVENGEVTREEIEFMKAQLTELLTNYGRIDYMNFDGWSTWPTTPDFDDVHYAELYKVVKAIQPDCLIINHCYESNLAHADVPFADAAGRSYPYHPDYSCPTAASDTLQRDWWFDDHPNYGKVRRSVDYVLKQLDSYNSHNGVYILNIAPNAAGRLPDDCVQRLGEVAEAWERPADLTEPEPQWGFQYEVSKNLAFMRPATQSSLHPHVRDKRAYPRAEIAVDGVTQASADMEQTSMTALERWPWWNVDLERDCQVDRIVIHRRTDGGDGDLLKGAMVSVLDADGAVVWHHKQSEAAPEVLVLDCPSVVGRQVRVQLRGDGSLCLGEVIVEGTER